MWRSRLHIINIMAKKTRTELSTSAINTNLPDNTQELITPTTERAQLTDERESVINYKDDLGGTGNAGKFLTVATDGESLTMVDAPTGDVTGTGAQYQVAVWDGTNSLTGNAAFQFLTGAQNSIKLIRGTGSGNILFYAADGTTLHGYIENQVSGNGLTIGQQDGSTSAVIDLDDSTITFKTDNNTALTISSGGDATFSGNVEVKNETAASFARLTIDNTIDNYNSEISFKSIYGGTTAKEFRIGSNIGVGSGSWEVYDVTASETRFSISSGGDVNIGSSDGLPLMHGSVAANASYCTYSFVNDPDTGMIRTGANTLALVTAGSSRLTISSTGKVGVGVSPDTNSKLTIKGSGDSGTSNSIAVYNFANSSIFTVRDDGHITMNTLTNGPYSNGVSGRDLIINSAGQLGTSVSIRKAKINIENEIDVSWLYNLNPVKFNYRKKDKKFNYLNEAEEEQKHGLIAEEVEKINTDFCWYNVNEEGDKTLAGVDYKMLITPMLKAIQEQQAIIEELKSRIETLEG